MIADIARQEIGIRGLSEKFPYKYPIRIIVTIRIMNLDDLKSFPDLDNVLKGICDGFTGVVYPDDNPLYVRAKAISILIAPQLQEDETWITIDAI